MVETLVKKLERKEMQTLETTRVFKKKQKKQRSRRRISFTLPSQMKSITFFLFCLLDETSCAAYVRHSVFTCIKYSEATLPLNWAN